MCEIASKSHSYLLWAQRGADSRCRTITIVSHPATSCASGCWILQWWHCVRMLGQTRSRFLVWQNSATRETNTLKTCKYEYAGEGAPFANALSCSTTITIPTSTSHKSRPQCCAKSCSSVVSRLGSIQVPAVQTMPSWKSCSPVITSAVPSEKRMRRAS